MNNLTNTAKNKMIMSKNITVSIIITCFVFLIENSKAQNTFPSSGSAGIGTASPNGSSILEMKSTTQGVLVPRMTKNQRDAIVTPATGLLVYQTNSTPGFYYWDGAGWSSVSSGANTTLSNLGTTSLNKALLPNASGTLNLGSDALKWKNVYVTSIKYADGTTQSTAGGGGAETDPQVGTNTTGCIPYWDGAALSTGLLKQNTNSVWLGNYAFSPLAKFDVYNNTGIRSLYLQNDFSSTSTKEGIYNWVGSQGTGGKTGINNIVWQTNSATGTVYGLYNNFQNYGSGNGYGTYNYMDILGSGVNYGNYTQMTSGTSGTLYGDYQTINGLGSLYGQYISIPSTSGSNTKTGVYVNIPSTAGTNYGLFSIVNENNSGSYSAFLYGKVFCSGNVGIGTTNPEAQLHVDFGEDAELASGGYIISGSTSSSNVAIDNNEIMARNNGATSTLYLQNNGGDLNLCYSGGNVMIGASVPATGYLLSVDGKIMCEELKVSLSGDWPDYVFDENYSMHSIRELKSFVKANKHLPGIPTAAEIKENGISVGEMQTKMMQTIEELSLYIIDLQNQIDELKTAQH